jgi:hypothetical protein
MTSFRPAPITSKRQESEIMEALEFEQAFDAMHIFANW